MATHLRRRIPVVLAAVLAFGMQACVPDTLGDIRDVIQRVWWVMGIGLVALGGIAVTALRKASAAERELRVLQDEVDALARRSSGRSE
ncbi:hypothetical protein JY651_27795 [Pyxidicoccus parkwayensis]|jgi:hypothetical protein|uniref:Lipoprotein n=1 Tax=Pyxidicoccus parkwayensis TaxID=2813578 RepID=A0ABX7NL96_9BACT|nr:hypothetical protein [Pyxidicoccus parkwaysis]QSQ19149.1 hypothetical protein JY651_27795 [Pyxidicoccus parkwaysis]